MGFANRLDGRFHCPYAHGVCYRRRMETTPEASRQARLVSKGSALAVAALLAPLPVFILLVKWSV